MEMEKKLQDYLRYAKTLDYEALVQEGRLCWMNLLKNVQDFSSGEIISEDEFDRRVCAFSVSTFLVCVADGDLSIKEIVYISQTTGLSQATVASTAVDAAKLSKDGKTAAIIIGRGITSQAAFDALVKYCAFLSAVDGSVSYDEEKLIKAVVSLGNAIHS